jgi:hypothetical protein
MGQDGVGGANWLKTADSDSWAGEAVVLRSTSRAVAANSPGHESVTSLPQAANAGAGAVVGGPGWEGNTARRLAVASVSVPAPLIGYSSPVVPNDRYQEQHCYGKQPTPPSSGQWLESFLSLSSSSSGTEGSGTYSWPCSKGEQ